MESFDKWQNLHVNRQRILSYRITHICNNVQKSFVLTKITFQTYFLKTKLL